MFSKFGILFKMAVSFVFVTSLDLKCIAGGVSDGGGDIGTTQPAKIEWIISALREYAAPAIIGFLNREETNFRRMSEAERVGSPYQKLFLHDYDVFEVIRNIKIEIRESYPCYDQAGNPKDGSVDSQVPNQVCISAYAISKKVNNQNYQAETIALLLHEISHLVGADENEANQIQSYGLSTFSHSDLLGYLVNTSIVSRDRFGELFNTLELLERNSAFVNRSDLLHIKNKILQLRDVQVYEGYSLSGYQRVRDVWIRLITPNLILLDVNDLYLCANEQSEGPEGQNYCEKIIRTGFQAESVVSASTFLNRIEPPFDYPEEWNSVLLEKPTNAESFRSNLLILHKFLEAIADQIRSLDKAKFQLTIK